MKKLSLGEIDELPNEVRFIYIMSIIGQPIGLSVFKEAINKYPEYFQEEIERERRFNSVPKYAWAQFDYFNNLSEKSLPIEPNPGAASPHFASWYSRNRPLMEQLAIEREDNFKKYIQPFLD